MIRWTGRNTKDVKRWVFENTPEVPYLTGLFVLRRMTNMTETLWQNIADDDWGKDVAAALWDQTKGHYLPVRIGDVIRKGDDGIVVESPPSGTLTGG